MIFKIESHEDALKEAIEIIGRMDKRELLRSDQIDKDELLTALEDLAGTLEV